MSRTPWWRSYFDDAYFRLHDPLFSQARTRTEVAGICELFGLPVGSHILDAPCGWGRHAALLARAGFQVTGADLSCALLCRAQTQGQAHQGGGSGPEAAAAPGYVAADIRALPFADGSFDGVMNVFTSLGLFASDEEDVAALREAGRVLRPGGRLLLESMHRDDVITQYAERDGWTLPDGTEVRVRRRFDPVSGVSHERLRWRRGNETGRKQHALRLRTATEIDALLHAAGFVSVAYYGGWDGASFTHRDQSLIAVAVS
jgi:SAM-dependent methyltransferase